MEKGTNDYYCLLENVWLEEASPATREAKGRNKGEAK